MIFVILGSQKFQFNRLLEYIDELVDKQVITEKIVAQGGYSDYHAKNYTITPFFNQEDFLKNISDADIVVTHAGTGAIVTALKNRKKVIAVPRLKKYAEHVDDHQIQIVKNFVDKNFILEAHDKETLGTNLLSIRNHQFELFESNNSNYISTIKDFLFHV